MKRFDVLQGSPEWHALRLGIPTASCFDKIMTPKTMKPSESRVKYAHKLIAEQILGVPLDDASSGFIARGAEQEQDARDYYELKHDCDIEPVGFVTLDNGRVGCSPDGLVGNDGLVEIKVPSAQVHVSYLLDVDGIGYKSQVQGQLWVCEREWCDTLSYNDKMPKALVRQTRDEAFIKALSSHVATFAEYIEQLKELLIARGLFTAEDFRRRDIAPAGPFASAPVSDSLWGAPHEASITKRRTHRPLEEVMGISKEQLEARSAANEAAARAAGF